MDERDVKHLFLEKLRAQRRGLAPAAGLPDALRRAVGDADFVPAVRTILCVDAARAGAPARARIVEAMEGLARTHGAFLVAGGDRFVYASFRDPRGAVHMAAALHRAGGCARLAMSLVTGACHVVHSASQAQDFLVLLDVQRPHAEALARVAGSGAVQVSRATFQALDDHGRIDALVVPGSAMDGPETISPSDNLQAGTSEWDGLPA